MKCMQIGTCVHMDECRCCKLRKCAYVTGAIFSFSKYSRENIPKDPPKFRVGDAVRVVVETDVTSVGEDCDGTPLYGLRNHGFGFGEESMTLIEKE